MQIHCQAILFDLDGTLVDSTAAVVEQWAVWAARHSIPLESVLAISHGVPATETMRRLAPHIDIAAEAAEHVRAEERNTSGVVAVGGARPLLSSLPPERWAIVTSCPRGLALARLRATGMPEPAHMVVAEDITKGKPDPEPYLKGAARLGVAPADCLVFEDAPAGIASARSAGMQVVGITTTFDREKLACPLVLPDFSAVHATALPDGLTVTIDV